MSSHVTSHGLSLKVISLFQFGFTRQSTDLDTVQEPASVNRVPASLPTHRESGLGMVEYDGVTSAVLEVVCI